jgi:hypothetical protein
MCFSATSSLIAAAVLLPAGIYTLAIARHGDGRYGLLAAFPLLFGIQQTFEGLLWLQLAESPGPDVYGMAFGSALAFLFFAYLVWPGLVPLAAWRIERDPWRRRLFGATALLGWIIGGSLFIPLLAHPDWLQVEVMRGSLLYHSQLIYDPYIAPHLGRLLYALIVLLPLIGSSDSMVRHFGVLILASVLVSVPLFSYAFVSIWCFFVALLSVYLAVRLPEQILTAPVPIHR